MAKSQNPSSKTIIPLREKRDRGKRWVRAGHEHSPLILHIEHPFLGEKVSLAFMRHWILPLRASPACRMTCGWGERLEDETRPLKYRYTNYTIRTGDVQCLNTWINQQPSEKMPGSENTKSGILQWLFICRNSELNPRTKNIAHCTNKTSVQRIKEKS